MCLADFMFQLNIQWYKKCIKSLSLPEHERVLYQCVTLSFAAYGSIQNQQWLPMASSLSGNRVNQQWSIGRDLESGGNIYQGIASTENVFRLFVVNSHHKSSWIVVILVTELTVLWLRIKSFLTEVLN